MANALPRTIRWLAAAQTVTLAGSAASRFALGLVVYEAERRVGDLSFVLVAGFLPGLLLTPLIGAGVDRHGPLPYVILGDVLGAGAVTALLVALSGGTPDRWGIAAASAAFSVAAAMQAPAISALVPRLVAGDTLPAANGWLSGAAAVADLLGPVLGGALLAGIGIHGVLVFDLVSYVGSAALVTSRWRALGGAGGARPSGSAFDQLAGGVRELLSHRDLLRFVLLGAAFNFLYGMNAVVAQPYVLGFADEGTLGLLYGALAVGMFAGAASAGRLGRRSAVSGMVATLGALGLALAVSGLVPWAPAVAACWLASGAALALLGSLSTTVIQRAAPPERHGRLFAAVQGLAWCVLPAAQLSAGWLADGLFGERGLGVLVTGLGLGLVALAIGASRMPSLWRLDGVPA